MGKVAVFGMLKRGGKVYVKIVPDTKTATLLPIITRKLLQIALFIQIAIVVIMPLMSVILAIIESIIQKNLLRIKIISMVLKISGIKQNEY